MTQTFNKNLFQDLREDAVMVQKTERAVRQIDQRIHELLRIQNPTETLWHFIWHLKERQEKQYRTLFFPIHVEALERAVDTLSVRIRKEKTRRDEFESAYEYIGIILKDVTHSHIRKTAGSTDHPESLRELHHKIQKMIHVHKDLSTRLAATDDSPGKVETRRLAGTLNRINYYLEYKRFETERFINEEF